MHIALPEEYLTMIGRVCFQWNTLEEIVDLVLRKLLGFDMDDMKPRMLTAHMTWPLKMDVLGSLIDFYRPDNPHLAGFDRVKPMLARAQSARNKVIHAAWHYQDGQVYLLRATARGKLKTNIDPITLDDVANIADDIGRAGVALYKLIFKL